MKLEMDKKNKYNELEDLGMCDPFHMEESFDEAIFRANCLQFEVDLYPFSVMEKAQEIAEKYGEDNLVPPRCIFIPTRQMCRKIINAVLKFGTTDTLECFLLRFGLLDGNRHLN
jgi:hypothetical protein